MPTTIIKHIQGRDIPAQWTKDVKENLDQTFTLIIRAEGKHRKPYDKGRLKRRNHIFDLLEGGSGHESSEEWIEMIKSSRTVSPLRANFE